MPPRGLGRWGQTSEATHGQAVADRVRGGAVARHEPGLKTAEVLRDFGPTAPERMHGYRLYVEDGPMREVRDPAEASLACGVRAAVLRSRRCRDRQAREPLAALIRRYGRGTMPAGALARAMGLSYSGFVHASDHGRTRAHSADPAWARAVSHLLQ